MVWRGPWRRRFRQRAMMWWSASDVCPAEMAKPRANAESLDVWSARTKGRVVTVGQAASHGEVLFNLASGSGSLDALGQVAAHLAGKVVVDVSNLLDFSHGMPPFLMAEFAGPTNLAEQIQTAFPAARVIKAFNSVPFAVMVNPALLRA